MRNDRVLSASYNLQKGWLEFEVEVYSTADIKEKKIAPFNTIKEFDLGEDDNE